MAVAREPWHFVECQSCECVQQVHDAEPGDEIDVGCPQCGNVNAVFEDGYTSDSEMPWIPSLVVLPGQKVGHSPTQPVAE
jgi:hypothetical protein